MRLRPLVSTTGVAALTLALAACAGVTTGSEAREGEVSGTLSVYAAASLTGAFDEIADAFTAEHEGVTIVPVYDGSSTLAAQINEGAPADVFASADESNMDKVADAAIDPQVFATNTLVIAVPAGNPAGIETLADLAEATVVLCAPEVPCGAASATLLADAGVAVTAASLEQNVTAVRTKVAAGEADAGLVYATDVVGDDALESITPEGADQVVNRYPIAALSDAVDPDLAAAFVAFVLSDEGQRILADAGFGAP
ncbi:molybdate ABC transporter substrate-binding protein [Microbacterium sp. P04]|uniref:molybdate ABC transporter substrate-binding protein n=1 Tax=Microbacterium sp. P04 TaxID=3366947 RepID=UPI0037478223